MTLSAPKSSPPPSKRRRTNDGIPLTAMSAAMTEALRTATLHAKDQLYVPLVVHTDDLPEVPAFAARIAEHLSIPSPRIVLHTDLAFAGPEDRGEESCSGFLILKAHQMGDPMRRAFAALHHNGHKYEIVIATIPNVDAWNSVLDSWAATTQVLFADPVIFPSLRDRERDHEGILHAIASTCVSQDGARRAQFDDAAKNLLLTRMKTRTGRARRVEQVRSDVNGAFDIMLRTSSSRITAEHVRYSWNPQKRAALRASSFVD